MNKQQLVSRILEVLDADLERMTAAARTAHQAATHEENRPENKYDTLGLEASYIAQGQANRAQEIRAAAETFRQLALRSFANGAAIRLSALVRLEDAAGGEKLVFLGPLAGGLKVGEVVVVTPESPFGRALLGKCEGDEVRIGSRAYEIVEVL